MRLDIFDDGFWNFRMLDSHHSKKSRRPACLSMSVAARYLLMLLVWSGPIPVCHSHGTLANTSNMDDAFEQHLRTYHRDVDLFSDVQMGLHFPLGPASRFAGRNKQRKFVPCLFAL